jgi:hypothetical protein
LTTSKCHWITSGVIGSSRKSGSVAGRRRPLGDQLRAQLWAVRADDDVAAQGNGEQLSAKADTQRRHFVAHRTTQELANRRQPRP